MRGHEVHQGPRWDAAQLILSSNRCDRDEHSGEEATARRLFPDRRPATQRAALSDHRKPPAQAGAGPTVPPT
ncbi:hypothetical protein SKAU_G00028470 [Synaphobranchus kaupii]|uniref:Uncharacterized protein n=1 Tax=Synaphobranchus kaupii TaxID=118154 RepID=A0A9Q1GDB4_SYNKA|nr:hypothetical protein SKAU_G00028470 [Synaphobranchus kaupii]